MIVADDTLFNLAEFVVRVEVNVGFDVLERRIKRYGFACDRDAVGEALFAVERLGFVKVVGTVDEVVDAHKQAVCVVRCFKEARRVLV